MFNQFARQLARGERITAHDRGYHAGYLAALDYLIDLPQKAKAAQFRNQQKKVS